MVTTTTHSTVETEALGQRLGRLLPDRAIVTFTGDLGSGKTTLIRGLVAVRSADPVSSPTYVYHNRYAVEVKRQTSNVNSSLPSVIDHVDLYRVQLDPALRARSGIDELLNSVPGWLLIEWPLADLVYPADVPRVAITASGAPGWSFTIDSSLPLSQALLERP